MVDLSWNAPTATQTTIISNFVLQNHNFTLSDVSRTFYITLTSSLSVFPLLYIVALLLFQLLSLVALLLFQLLSLVTLLLFQLLSLVAWLLELSFFLPVHFVLSFCFFFSVRALMFSSLVKTLPQDFGFTTAMV